jgi:hypothetical protein
MAERAAHEVRVAVERIMDDTALTAPARRARIFRLWDDCAEDAAGRRARAVIEGFVRRHLPQGGSRAYGEAELRALNAERLSEAPFRPYGR